jgi:AcrR family transcriptional regulator
VTPSEAATPAGASARVATGNGLAAMAPSRPRFSEATRELLRERVLGAVGDLLRERAWGDLTMSDVAERAGVSRQTLYNGFGSRAELAGMYLAREAEAFLSAADAAIRAHADDPQRALTAALEGFLTAADSHPLVIGITSPDGSEELLPLVTTRGGLLVDAAREHLCASILDTWPGVSRASAESLADVLVRIAISYAALPAAAPGETAARVACVLGPAIGTMLGDLRAS